MQKLKKPLEEPYRSFWCFCELIHHFRRLLINYLNLVFGSSEASDRYWNVKLKDDIRRNFIKVQKEEYLWVSSPSVQALTKEESSSTYMLKPRIGKQLDLNFLSLVFMRLQKLVGMKLDPRCGNPLIFNSEAPFYDTDLETLPIRVKHMVWFSSSSSSDTF